MTLLLWMDTHPWTFLIVVTLGAATMLWLAIYWPLSPDQDPETGPYPFPPTGLVRRVPLRPFDWAIDDPDVGESA